METWTNGLPLLQSPSLSGSDDIHRAPSVQSLGTPNSSTSWEVVSSLEFEMPPLVNPSPDEFTAFWLGDGARDGSSSMHGEAAANGISISVVDHDSFLLEADAAQHSSPTDCCSASVAGATAAGAALDEAIPVHRATASVKAPTIDGPLVGGLEPTGQNRLTKMLYSRPGEVPADSTDACCTAHTNISGHDAIRGGPGTEETMDLKSFLGEEVPSFPFAVAALHGCSSSAEPLVA